MPVERLLILGGTSLAREAAEALDARRLATLTSLAGVTTQPLLPKGEVRKGGFGGAAGLEAFLRENRFAAVIDATHPFAAQMSAQAALACSATHVPLVRMEPPAWVPQDGDDWVQVDDIAAAVSALPTGARAAVTVGRKEIGQFFARHDLTGMARMIEPPALQVPPGWDIVLERPPFQLEGETELLRRARVTVLVSKNAGGVRPAKLDAARSLGLTVIMVMRPDKPEAKAVSSITDLLGWLDLHV